MIISKHNFQAISKLWVNDELVWSEEYADPQSYENVEVFVSQPNWDAADTKVKDLYVKSFQF